MVTEVFSLLTNLFSSLVGIFETMLVSTGFSGFYLGAVFLFLVGKFLLRPLFGSSGSDKVRRRKDSNNE